MTTIQATIKGRRLELEVPADWPDGIVVEIHPVDQNRNGDAEAMPPDEIAKTLAAMDRVEPLEITEAERSAWEAARKARTDREKAQFATHADELRRVWE